MTTKRGVAAVKAVVAEAGGVVLPRKFGEGWLTNNAADLVRIACAFGGFDVRDVVVAISKIHRGSGLANAATVGRALQQVKDDWPE